MRWSIYLSPSNYQLEHEALAVLTRRLFAGLNSGDIRACRIDDLEQLFVLWFRLQYPHNPTAGLDPENIVEAFFV